MKHLYRVLPAVRRGRFLGRIRWAGLIVCLTTLVVSSGLRAQDRASARREQASPERIVESLRRDNVREALEYYRSLVNRTKELHAPSLRRICQAVVREALENNSVDVRIQAARALRYGVDTETVPLVLEVLRQREVPDEFIINEPFLPVRAEGLLPLVLKALEDKNEIVRVWAVHALAEIGGPQVVEPLSQSLDDPYIWVRIQAVLALGQLGFDPATRERIRLLRNDPSPPVVLDATAALFVHGDTDLEGDLREMLNSPDPHLPGHFVAVAEALKSPALSDLLVSLLNNKAASVRMRAAQAVGRLKLTKAFAQLMDMLSDNDISVRAAAAQALGELGTHQAAPELDRLATTSTGQLKVAAVAALGKFSSATVLVTLRRALLDDDPAVRLAAAQSLGHIEDEEVLPVLQAVYTDRDEAVTVRAHAAVSAARLGDYRAIVQLNTDAQDEDRYVRVWAAWGLGEVGQRGQLFTLVNLLADEDEMVRPVAARATLKLSTRLEEAEESAATEAGSKSGS